MSTFEFLSGCLGLVGAAFIVYCAIGFTRWLIKIRADVKQPTREDTT